MGSRASIFGQHLSQDFLKCHVLLIGIHSWLQFYSPVLNITCKLKLSFFKFHAIFASAFVFLKFLFIFLPFYSFFIFLCEIKLVIFSFSSPIHSLKIVRPQAEAKVYATHRKTGDFSSVYKRKTKLPNLFRRYT